MEVRAFKSGDETKICEIYNYYIKETLATFEEMPLSVPQMRERIDGYILHYPWFVCELDDKVVGYAYASKFHQRTAYRHTAEATVYIRNGFARRGIGKALYQALLTFLRNQDCHSVMALIALPNAGSIGLHESFQFAKVGHIKEVGRKFGQWVDVGYWQRLL